MTFAGVLLLLWIEKRTFSTRRPGTYGALFFVLYGIARFVYEMFRSGYSSESTWGVPMTDAQVMALAMIAGGVVWLLVLRGVPLSTLHPKTAPLRSEWRGNGSA